jgi:hypothetical protein
VPKITALTQDLNAHLSHYNYDRTHTGRLTQGRVPQTSSTEHAKPARDDDHLPHQPKD